jgi:hypothetical protein
MKNPRVAEMYATITNASPRTHFLRKCLNESQVAKMYQIRKDQIIEIIMFCSVPALIAHTNYDNTCKCACAHVSHIAAKDRDLISRSENEITRLDHAHQMHHVCSHHYRTRVTYSSQLVTVTSRRESGCQRKEVKALYFFGWGGHQKPRPLFTIFFTEQAPTAPRSP